jgi:NAD(P)-dependent dehydrogenase (short-subunit alcohol dehydrogenase family)
MVANAGIVPVAPFLESKCIRLCVLLNVPYLKLASVELLDKTFAVNVRGTFLCYKYAGIQMVKQGRGGRIIGASSLAGKTGGNALKFALRS